MQLWARCENIAGHTSFLAPVLAASMLPLTQRKSEPILVILRTTRESITLLEASPVFLIAVHSQDALGDAVDGRGNTHMHDHYMQP